MRFQPGQKKLCQKWFTIHSIFVISHCSLISIRFYSSFFFDRSRLLFFLISLIGSLHFFNLSIRHRINPFNFIINCLKSHDLFHPCWNKNVLQWNDTRCDTNLLFIHIISFRVKKKQRQRIDEERRTKKKLFSFVFGKKW